MRAWPWFASIAAASLPLITLLWWVAQPQPRLDGVVDLIESGQYDPAETRLREYLLAHPRDNDARFMLALASLQRPDSRPELALEQLEAIRPPDRFWKAQVRATEGKARFFQQRYDLAEAAWSEALRLDPKVAEAGWGLLDLYALQGRDEDARRLGLRLFETEPDPHDRVQLLLQLIRHDAHVIAADSIVNQLEPVVRKNPEDLHSSLALGSAQVRDGRFDEGLKFLGRLVDSHPEQPEVWRAYVEALIVAGHIETLARTLDRLPASLVDDPRFEAERGLIAAQRGDWPEASRAYLRAWQASPDDATLAYRLLNSLTLEDRRDELERLGPRLRAIGPAFEKLRELYDQIDALPDLGRTRYDSQFRELSETLKQIGRDEEADAWLQLAHEPHATDPSVPIRTTRPGQAANARTSPSLGDLRRPTGRASMDESGAGR